MKLYDVEINDKKQGVSLISLVEDPANKQELIPVCSGLEVCHLSNGNEFIVPILIPEQEILRIDEDDEFYNLKFTAGAIKTVFVDFMKRKRLSNTDINHDGKVINNKILFLEMWIKESDTDKSIRFFDLPIGTWFTKLKVLDQSLITLIEEGKIKGVSIYGEFEYKLINNNESMESTKKEQFKEVMTSLKGLVGLADETPAANEAPSTDDIEARIKALEEMVAKLIEGMAKKEPSKEEMAAEAEAKAKTEADAKAKEEEDDKAKTEMAAIATQLAAIEIALKATPVSNQLNGAPAAQNAPAPLLSLSEIIKNNQKNN